MKGDRLSSACIRVIVRNFDCHTSISPNELQRVLATLSQRTAFSYQLPRLLLPFSSGQTALHYAGLHWQVTGLLFRLISAFGARRGATTLNTSASMYLKSQSSWSCEPTCLSQSVWVHSVRVVSIESLNLCGSTFNYPPFNQHNPFGSDPPLLRWTSKFEAIPPLYSTGLVGGIKISAASVATPGESAILICFLGSLFVCIQCGFPEVPEVRPVAFA